MIPTQLMFYSRANYAFAFQWASVYGTDRWIFPVDAIGPELLYYTAMRLQGVAQPAVQVLMATQGGGAHFYASPDDAAANSSGVVGQLPGNTTPADFGATIAPFLNPSPTFTILGSGVAGDDTVDGTTYRGKDLMSMLAAVTGGVVRAWDTVTLNPNGTATYVGAAWRCNATGDPYVESIAAKDGAPCSLDPVTP